MNDVHSTLVLVMFVLAALTFFALLFVVAPYGRHYRAGWGPCINRRLGWFLMELPASVLFLAIYLAGSRSFQTAPLCLLALWQLHYVHRTFVFPLRLRGLSKPMPVLIVALGFSFNCLNAYVNATWIGGLGNYADRWLADPRFLGGAALFVVGFSINYHADAVLLRLRRRAESGYKVPRGGLFELITSPNYFGEIVAWCGWALAAWSTAGVAFAIYTAANLVPRALAHRKWYRERFPDYPRGRRAVIPYVL